jgi:hypothetical protein
MTLNLGTLAGLPLAKLRQSAQNYHTGTHGQNSVWRVYCQGKWAFLSPLLRQKVQNNEAK